MSVIEKDGQNGRAGAYGLPTQLALPIYSLTIFLSAFLLFSVQPMFTKMVMPTLGGTPAVWSVAMVFFQAVLLLGYAYAHGLTRWLDARIAAVVHVGLLIVVLSVGLPITFNTGLGEAPGHAQAFWLIGVFALSVGLPFFAVSANGPLLQAWFAQSGHPHAKDPYFLYGASNLGSLLALLAYPFVVEPLLSLDAQSALWSAGFLALAITIAVCALFLRPQFAGQQTTSLGSASVVTEAKPVTWGMRAGWIGYALVPSAFLVAITAHLSTDVAAVPLLWVVPLALFLLTFSFAFRAGGEGMDRLLSRSQPLLFAAMLATFVVGKSLPFWVNLIVFLTFFVVSVTICHRELYARRPDVQHLTQFYLFMSLGGVIGGVLASLVAPLIFASLLEFPLLVLAMMLCRADVQAWLKKTSKVWLTIATVITLSLFVALDRGVLSVADWPLWLRASVFLVPLAIAGVSFGKPARMLGASIAGLVAGVAIVGSGHLLERTRSFFAVHSIYQTETGLGRYLMHGTTLHGGEKWQPEVTGQPISRTEPASYFFKGGSYHQAIEAARATQGGLFKRVAVVGLGMGSLACHAKPREDWTFYEIDPEVVRIAKDRTLFRSFTGCTPNAEVVLGDGRLTLGKTTHTYDLIMLDAFSSASLPVHLVTKEAIELYKSKLSKNGVLIFNISNRNMKLAHVIAASAQGAGLVTYHRADNPKLTGDFMETLATPVEVAVAARSASDIASLSRDPSWTRTKIPSDFRVWTDDYSNILDPLRRKAME